MGTADCQFPLAVELQEVTEVPRSWLLQKGKLGNSDDSTLGGMSPTLRDGTHAVVEVEPQGVVLEADPCPVSEGSYAACLRAVAHRLITPSCLERVGQPFPPETDQDSQLILPGCLGTGRPLLLPGQQPDEDPGVDITQAQVWVLNQLPYPLWC